MKNIILGSIAVTLLLIVIAGVFTTRDDDGVKNEVAVQSLKGIGDGYTAVVYKSPSCGCCVGYADELEKQGFDVSVVSTDDMSGVKEEYGIPSDKQSCHTITIGDYVVEGHVPMEALAKLLNEQPDIEGIGLPRMPSGTPGMPGPKREPYEVYQLLDGTASPYVTI